jgi:hypothetical protein
MDSNKVNGAVISCLEYAATSTSPPGAGASDFLLRLMDLDLFTVEELDVITTKVSTILRAIIGVQLNASDTTPMNQPTIRSLFPIAPP